MRLQTLFLFASFHLLGSCGFTPLKTLDTSSYAPVFVDGKPSAIQRTLQSSLAEQRALSHTLSKALSVAEFQDIAFDTSDFSVSSDGRIAEYETSLRVRFLWQKKRTELEQVDQKTSGADPIVLLDLPLEVRETFSSNPLNPGAETAEKQQIRSRLEDSIVRAVLRAMSTVNAPANNASNEVNH